MGQPEETLTPMECRRCGACCRRHQPQLSPAEVKLVAAKLGLSIEEFLDKYVQTTIIGYLLRQSETGCIFLTTDKGVATCTIHTFRPSVCREWVPSLSRRECREGQELRDCE